MAKEKQIKEMLSDIAVYKDTVAQLMRTPIGMMIAEQCALIEQTEEKVRETMLTENIDRCESYDGTQMAVRQTRRGNIPFENLKETGLSEYIIAHHPNLVTVSPKICDTDVGNISAYADDTSVSIVVLGDDEYKARRKAILTAVRQTEPA